MRLVRLLLSAAAASVAMLLAMPQSESQDASRLDMLLVDQHGATFTPASVVERGEAVVVSFTFNGCSTICPVSNLVMAALDAKPGNFRLLTITVDPLNDTPEALAKTATDHNASERWSWLSGSPEDVYRTLDRLGIQFGNVADHSSYFLVFRKGGKQVLRLDRQSSADDLFKAVTTELSE